MKSFFIRVTDEHFDEVWTNSGLCSPCPAAFPSWFDELKSCLALQVKNTLQKERKQIRSNQPNTQK